MFATEWLKTSDLNLFGFSCANFVLRVLSSLFVASFRLQRFFKVI